MQKKSYLYKLILNIIIPLTLIALWISFTIFQIILNDGSLSVVTRKYSPSEIGLTNFEPILKGEQREFEFAATDNNLGYVSISFNTLYKNHDDYLLFKLIEKTSGEVIKEEQYFAAAFHGLNMYPFGFPIISDSKGKTYKITLTSLYGTEKSSVSIKKGSSIFSASYQYDSSLIKNDFEYSKIYLKAKLTNSYKNNFLFFNTITYLYPFIFYIAWLGLKTQFNKRLLYQNPLIALLGISVIIDVFFVDTGFDLVFLIIPIIWAFMLFSLKKESADSYKAALALLILCPILQLLGQDVMVEKAAAWAFLALTVGVIINIYELRKSSSKNKTK